MMPLIKKGRRIHIRCKIELHFQSTTNYMYVDVGGTTVAESGGIGEW
jgi:hypothetical protein